MGESLIGLVGSPVWSFQSSSSLVRLNLFFSWVSFSTYSWRLAFSSDSCLHGEKRTRSSGSHATRPWLEMPRMPVETAGMSGHCHPQLWAVPPTLLLGAPCQYRACSRPSAPQGGAGCPADRANPEVGGRTEGRRELVGGPGRLGVSDVDNNDGTGTATVSPKGRDCLFESPASSRVPGRVSRRWLSPQGQTQPPAGC